MFAFAINRRRFAAGAAAGIAAVVAAPALRAQGKPEKSSLVLAVGGKASLQYLPLTICEQLGYFRAEGLDVEISDFAGDARALQAALGSGADLCSGAFEHTIQLQSRGQSAQAFVLQGRAPQIAIGISSKTMPDYKSLADLKGRKIGVSALGSPTHMLACLLLARAGIPAADVGFVGVGTAMGALSALRAGQIDALSNTDPVMTMLEQKAEVRIVADTRTLKGTQEVFGGSMPAGCLYAPAEFIRKNPNTTQALTNAMVRSLKWLQTAGPGDIIKTVPESYLLGDRALYLASFHKNREAISPNGLMPEDGPDTALKALTAFDTTLKADKIDLDKLYTNEFVLQARARFKA